MREYGKVSPKFWIQGSGRKLRGDPLAQLVAHHLLTGPSSTMTGLYYLPLATLAYEVGEGSETHLAGVVDPGRWVRGALSRVLASGFAHYDPQRDLVWVENGAEIEFGDGLKVGDPRRNSIKNHLVQFGNHPFVRAFLHKYGDSYGISIDGVVAEPLRPIDDPSTTHRQGGNLCRTAADNQEQEQEQEQEESLASLVTAPPAGGDRLALIGTNDPKQAQSETWQLRDCFCACYAELYNGAAYEWDHARDGRHAKDLIKKAPGGLEQLLAEVDAYFGWKDPEVISQGHSFSEGWASFLKVRKRLQADIAAPERHRTAAIIRQERYHEGKEAYVKKLEG